MKRPNILHLFSDQQRVDSIRALGGHGFLQTPHLDRLCREGTVFSGAYTAAAECVPSRACMITGMYADKTGCGSNADEMPGEEAPTLMSLLQGAGYRTHGVGKCHFTPDAWALRGFDSRDTMEEIAIDPKKDDYLKSVAAAGFEHVLEPHGVRGEMYYTPQPSQVPEALHPTQWVGDRCLDFLQRKGKGKKPWYLYAGFVHPHPPFAPPNPWHKLYRAPEMPLPFLPENRDDLLCFINHFQNRYKYRDRGLDLNLIRCIRAYYFACVSFIDHQVGRILKRLEKSGELDNTLVVFSTDHGELLGDFGCFGKRSFHDASQRVPLIVRQPARFKAGAVCDTPASLVDLLPTFMAAAGHPAPEAADGCDLAALARGGARHTPVFFHYGRGRDAILGAVDGDWKYAWSGPDSRSYLFPRRESPEKRNRATDPRCTKVLERMDRMVRERAAQHDFSKICLRKDGSWKTARPRQMPADPDAFLLYQDPPKATPKLPAPYELEYPGKNVLGL